LQHISFRSKNGETDVERNAGLRNQGADPQGGCDLGGPFELGLEAIEQLLPEAPGVLQFHHNADIYVTRLARLPPNMHGEAPDEIVRHAALHEPLVHFAGRFIDVYHAYSPPPIS